MTSPNTTGISGRPAVAVALLLGIVGLSACSTEPASSDGPYAAEFDRARNESVTDFQREVLTDNVISDEEFREVRQRYVDCLSDAGMQVKALADGSYEFATTPTAEEDVAERQCALETTMSVEALYYSIRTNPQNEDFSLLTVECLQRQDVVDASFTKQDWDRFVSAFAAVAGGESGEATPPEADLPTLPGGVQMDDARVQECSTNPLGL